MNKLSYYSPQWCKFINDPYLNKIRAQEEPIPIMFQHHVSDLSKYLCKLSFIPIIQGLTTLEAEKEKDLVIFELLHHHSPPLPVVDIANLVIGFCNGLVLLQSPNIYLDIRYMVVNPLSKQCHRLPPIKIRISFQIMMAGGIGYDDSTNTFKIVSVAREKWSREQVDVKLRTRAYVVGTDRWREISQVPSYFIHGECVFAHGCMYWLARDNAGHLSTEPRKVVWYDVKEEEFGLIDHLPEQANGLVDFNGELGLVSHKGCYKVVWIFKQEEWVMHCQIDLRQRPILDNKVIGVLNKDGDILLASFKDFAIYRLKSGRIHEVKHGYGKLGECDLHFRMYRKSL